MREEVATYDGVFVVVRYGGVIAAVGTDDYVYFLPPITALERDHPRRRFVGVVALVGREMALSPHPEPYDDGLAQFYARILLIPIDDLSRPVSGRRANLFAAHRRRRRERPVVAAVDGSDASLTSAGTAARLAHAVDAPLVFVYVRTGPPDWLGKPYYQARLNSEMDAARRALDASVQVAQRENVDAETEVLEGKPARRIGEFAGARDAKLLVLGARRRRLKKSVSQSVIRDSSRPVVVTTA